MPPPPPPVPALLHWQPRVEGPRRCGWATPQPPCQARAGRRQEAPRCRHSPQLPQRAAPAAPLVTAPRRPPVPYSCPPLRCRRWPVDRLAAQPARGTLPGRGRPPGRHPSRAWAPPRPAAGCPGASCRRPPARRSAPSPCAAASKRCASGGAAPRCRGTGPSTATWPARGSGEACRGIEAGKMACSMHRAAAFLRLCTHCKAFAPYGTSTLPCPAAPTCSAASFSRRSCASCSCSAASCCSTFSCAALPAGAGPWGRLFRSASRLRYASWACSSTRH